MANKVISRIEVSVGIEMEEDMISSSFRHRSRKVRSWKSRLRQLGRREMESLEKMGLSSL